MQCPVCGTKIEKEWGFCPRCGSRVSGDFFDEIFSRMRKELAEMNRLLEKDIEAFDLSPWFRDMEQRKEGGTEEGRRQRTPSGKDSAFRPENQPKRSGFTIKIVQAGGRKPGISVRTFGDVDKGKLEKEINELGAWQNSLKPKEEPQSTKLGLFRKAGKPLEPQEKILIKGPMKTEEPKTSVARSASRVVVSIQLPGVESEKDIEVSELENSVEVKALAKDRAYFKILTKPSKFRLAKKSFEKGILHMEFS